MLSISKTLLYPKPRFYRLYTTTLIKTRTIQQYNNESVKLIAVPINSTKTFVYFKHSDQLSNKKSKLIKWEQTIVKRCKTLWNKMEKSPKPMNLRIVSLVNQYMNRIPWQEDSLLSIPGENYIMKRISQESMKDEEELVITAKQYRMANPPPKLLPISIYHPKSISPIKLTSQLKELSQRGLKYHLKEIYKCLFLLPLTFPLILVPIVPNIPGFYLSYRIYCNLKAYLGAKHLQKILNDDLITFKQIAQYNEILPANNSELTSQTITEITQLFNIPEMDSILERSLLQESHKN